MTIDAMFNIQYTPCKFWKILKNNNVINTMKPSNSGHPK